MATGCRAIKRGPRGVPSGVRFAQDSPRMAEVFVQFAEPVIDSHGRAYVARACGGEMPDGMWQGWIEFLPGDGGETLRSPRETTQPNRQDTSYWATGLSDIYLEGALRRAQAPPRVVSRPAIGTPAFDAPAEDVELAKPPVESILNPYSVYRKGEALLRNQLAALSAWHLANIAMAYRLSEADGATLNRMPASVLIEIIVSGVQQPRVEATR